MKENRDGWVVVNIGHPATGNKFFSHETFSYLRKDAIAKFVSGCGNNWNYWKNKFNFRVVKATQTIITKPLNP